MEHEIIYSSIATPGITEQEVEQLLLHALEYNSVHNISGCLIYYNMEFFQLLEGDEQEVKTLYDRICLDKRHKNVFLVASGPIKERSFPQHAMKFHVPDEQEIKELTEVTGIKEFNGLHAFRAEHITGKKVFDFISEKV